MQQTDKWQLNLIEADDEIIDSIAAINANFNRIDENLATGGENDGGGGGIENETDPTVPEHVKTISETDIEKWNNKQDKLTAGDNITIDENGTISATASESESTNETLIFENTNVEVEMWVEDDTYELFGYRADIPLEGVTEEFFPEVVFNIEDVISCNYSTICLSGDGIVTIYAVQNPAKPITILTIRCSKGG